MAKSILTAIVYQDVFKPTPQLLSSLSSGHLDGEPFITSHSLWSQHLNCMVVYTDKISLVASCPYLRDRWQCLEGIPSFSLCELFPWSKKSSHVHAAAEASAAPFPVTLPLFRTYILAAKGLTTLHCRDLTHDNGVLHLLNFFSSPCILYSAWAHISHLTEVAANKTHTQHEGLNQHQCPQANSECVGAASDLGALESPKSRDTYMGVVCLWRVWFGMSDLQLGHWYF